MGPLLTVGQGRESTLSVDVTIGNKDTMNVEVVGIVSAAVMVPVVVITRLSQGGADRLQYASNNGRRQVSLTTQTTLDCVLQHRKVW